MAKANVNDIACFFIALAQDAGEQLTHMKLQKLIYYSQAWYLGMYGEPLFNSSIEAWKHGPVCPEIYHEYKKYERQNIPFPQECSDAEGCVSYAEKKLDYEIVTFLNQIADDYMSYSAYQLRSMTHKDDPWIDAIRSSGEITQKAMCDYYSELVMDESEMEEISEGCRHIQDGKGVEWKPGMFS